MSFKATGNSYSISAGPTTTVVNVATFTNTFRFLNANATGYSYVGVFPTYEQAAAAHHPSTNSTIGGELIPVAPTWAEEVVGNFGLNPQTPTGNVYIAAVTAVSSGQIVIATPLVP